ncbi:hypothetical protein CSIM01_09756 [Colletotrichum simmondsii]|uniref:Uncharacterized protein n=1 Tax=Colletotrichum simmondsii TaxID=703756 RepID=A0A135RXG4_9PEZI|nr:hypothetical protein CSIM01_09756 [Colletotrichum simmondsii]
MSSAQGNNEFPLPLQDGGVSSHSQQRHEWEENDELMEETRIVLKSTVFVDRYKHLDTIQLGDVLDRSEQPDEEAHWRNSLYQAFRGYLKPGTEDNNPRPGYLTTMNNAFHTLRIDGRNFHHLVSILTCVKKKDWVEFPKRILIEYGNSTVPMPGGAIWKDKTKIVQDLFKKEFFFDSDDFTPNNGGFLEYAGRNEEITTRRNCILIFLLLQILPNVDQVALDKRIAKLFCTENIKTFFDKALGLKKEERKPIKTLPSLSWRGMNDDQYIRWEDVCWLSTIMPSKHLFLEGEIISAEPKPKGLMNHSDITFHKAHVKLGAARFGQLINLCLDEANISAFRYVGKDVSSGNTSSHDTVGKLISDLKERQSQSLKTLCIGLCGPSREGNVDTSPVDSLEKLTSLTHLWIDSGKTIQWNDSNIQTFTQKLPPSLNHLRITGNVQDVKNWIYFVQQYPDSVFSKPKESKLGVSQDYEDLVESIKRNFETELHPKLYVIKDQIQPLFKDPFVAQTSGGTEIPKDERESDILLWRINDDTAARTHIGS